MKKILNYTFLLLASAALALTGCKNEELVFDHELQQMETKADAILLEFIAPAGTALDEQIYITGEFNKGDKYLLEKTKNDKKWAIYLYESDFTAAGKTLKDGFTFGSEKNGLLCDMKGKVDTLTTDITFGQWTNLWGMRWASYFKTDNDEPGEIVPGEYEHLYIIGNVEGIGWTPADVLEFEMVGTDIFRGEFTFTSETSYFAILTAKGADNDDWGTVNAARWGANDALLTEGAVLDLKLQDGSDQCVTIAQGTYTITVNMAEKQIVIGNGEWATGGGSGSSDKWPSLTHDGDAVYVCNNAGWEELALYMWGDVNDLNGGWPGMQPTGTFKFKGFDWYYFDLGAANAGKTEHVIINNNGHDIQIDDVLVPTLTAGDSIYYVIINEDKTFNRIEDPLTYEYPKAEPTPDDPEPTGHDTIYVTVKDTITTNLYLVDASTNMHYLYAWGTSELFGGWPGAKWAEWETATFFGQAFHHYEFKAEYGSEFNLIINNKGYSELAEADQKQYDAFTLKVGAKTELFYTVKDGAMEEMKPTAAQAAAIRRLFRK